MPEDAAWLHGVWDADMFPHGRENEELVRSRLLFYLRRYPFTKRSHDELTLVADTLDVARHVRRLRKREGWLLTSGRTVREMEACGEWSLGDLDASALANNGYVLLTTETDRLAAARWYKARDLREEVPHATDRVLAFFKGCVGQAITKEELRYLAGPKWARRVRELRTEYGWPIKTRNSDRRDLPVGTYVLDSLEQLPEHDRRIPDDVQVAVLARDGYACRKCGWQRAALAPGDPRHSLDLNRLALHSKGGANTAANLLTLCNVHHKQVHRDGLDEAAVRAWLPPLA